MRTAKLLIALLSVLLVSAACSVLRTDHADQTGTANVGDSDPLPPTIQHPTNEHDQEIVIISIRKAIYESVADRLAEIEVMHTLHSGAGLIWFELESDGFERLRATGIEFDRWHRIVVSLSKEAFGRVTDIENLHVTEHNAVVWLELTPSNLEKLRASGVKFEIRNAAMLRFGEYH